MLLLLLLPAGGVVAKGTYDGSAPEPKPEMAGWPTNSVPAPMTGVANPAVVKNGDVAVGVKTKGPGPAGKKTAPPPPEGMNPIVTEAALLVPIGSGTFGSVTVTVIVPCCAVAATATTRLIVAVAPGASGAVRVQVTVWPLAAHTKPPPEDDTKVTPAGRLTVTMIVPWEVGDGPLLVMSTSSVPFWPANIALCGVRPTLRSAEGAPGGGAGVAGLGEGHGLGGARRHGGEDLIGLVDEAVDVLSRAAQRVPGDRLSTGAELPEPVTVRVKTPATAPAPVRHAISNVNVWPWASPGASLTTATEPVGVTTTLSFGSLQLVATAALAASPE